MPSGRESTLILIFYEAQNKGPEGELKELEGPAHSNWELLVGEN
jgi:hypothetical protein